MRGSIIKCGTVLNHKWILAFAGKTIVLLYSLILVTSCIHHPPEQRICLQKCAKMFNLCQVRCGKACVECKQQNLLAAEHSYYQYIRETKVQGKEVTRQLQSYRDPLKCRQISCNCVVDKMICQNAC